MRKKEKEASNVLQDVYEEFTLPNVYLADSPHECTGALKDIHALNLQVAYWLSLHVQTAEFGRYRGDRNKVLKLIHAIR